MTSTATIYIFRQGTKRYGYTPDKSGANLAAAFPGTSWEALSAITPQPGDGPRAGPSMAVVQAGIAQDGCYVVDGVVRVTHGERQH